VGLLLNRRSFSKASAPPLFLEDKNIFQKSAPFVLWGILSPRGLHGGLYGQNLPYKFKNSYGDFRYRNFEKSHRTNWSPVRSETGFVILGKFWSRYDLQNFRKRKFLVDDQGEFYKPTVPNLVLVLNFSSSTLYSTSCREFTTPRHHEFEGHKKFSIKWFFWIFNETGIPTY
jgi:hypothetical protein